MTWSEDLQDYIAAAQTLVNGTNLFLGKRSDDADLPDEVVVMTEYIGTMIEHFGSENDLEQPNLQLFVRSNVDDYPGARDRAWALHRLLRRITERTIGTSYFHRVRPSGTPTPLGPDRTGRFQFLVDFSVLVDEPVAVP